MELKSSKFKIIYNFKGKILPLKIGEKMLFDNNILLWGIKHSVNGYEIKDIEPTSSFKDYPIFIGNKRISKYQQCYKTFCYNKSFFF